MTESNPLIPNVNNLINRLPSKGWTTIVFIVAILIATPILFVVSSIFIDAGSVWKHLAETVLTSYILNSLFLM